MKELTFSEIKIGQSVIVSQSGNAPMRIVIDGNIKKHGGKGYEDMDIVHFIRPPINSALRRSWLTLKTAKFYEDTGQKYYFQTLKPCTGFDEDLGYWEDKWFFDLEEAMTYAEKNWAGQCFQVVVEKIT